jgi:hypothetical protein
LTLKVLSLRRIRIVEPRSDTLGGMDGLTGAQFTYHAWLSHLPLSVVWCPALFCVDYLHAFTHSHRYAVNWAFSRVVYAFYLLLVSMTICEVSSGA